MGLSIINKLYRIEREMKEAWETDRYQTRQGRSKIIAEKLKALLDSNVTGLHRVSRRLIRNGGWSRYSTIARSATDRDDPHTTHWQLTMTTYEDSQLTKTAILNLKNVLAGQKN